MLRTELLENKSDLMVKDKELLVLQEHNGLLVKQFGRKKEALKMRKHFSQVVILASYVCTCMILVFHCVYFIGKNNKARISW